MSNYEFLGGIAGYSSGIIRSSSVSGTLVGTNSLSARVGGLVGFNTGQIIDSSANATERSDVTGGFSGGLVGLNAGNILRSNGGGSPFGGSSGGLAGVNAGSIAQSFATATVGNLAGYGRIGGLVGYNDGSITQSYATGEVTTGSSAGGLVGGNNGTVSQSYSTGAVASYGGLIGSAFGANGTVNSSYWDTQTSGQLSSTGGTPLTTAQFQSGILPVGFDPTVWTATPGQYPTLIGVGGQQQLSFRDYLNNIIQPAIHWTPVPGAINMTASFSPIDRTLTNAAHLGGYEHFNWYQIATEYPGSWLVGHPAPFVDPPPDLFGAPIGGLGVQRADTLPFYWDETNCFGCKTEFNLHDPSNTSTDDRTLSFNDVPSDIYIPLLGDRMSFTTQLVGIRENGTWDALSTFYWSNDYHCGDNFDPDCGGVSTSRNLDPFPFGGIGGVFDAYEITDLMDLPLNVRELMVQDGGTNIPLSDVPEPSSLALLASGLLGLNFCRRRRKAVVKNAAPLGQQA